VKNEVMALGIEETVEQVLELTHHLFIETRIGVIDPGSTPLI
jgi:hypothetical protein